MIEKNKPIIDNDLIADIKSQHCQSCGKLPGDPYNPIEAHHVTLKSHGRKDTVENLMPLCRICHGQWHSQSRVDMILNNYGVIKWLMQHGRQDIVDKAKWKRSVL